MEIRPFKLDRWLDEHQFASPPIELDLAASTGPRWTLRELLGFLDPDDHQRLLDAPVYYAPAAGDRRLRETIAEMAGVGPDDVQVTTGAQEALWIVFLLAAEAGANVLVPAPCFSPFVEIPRLLGLEVRRYELRAAAGFRADPEEIAAAIDRRTRLVLVNSPHNPTGAVPSADELAALHELAAARGVPLVVDEVFHPIHHGPPVPSASRLPRATVIGDLSKACCLSGLRLGWLIERDAARMARVREARMYLTVASSPMNEALAVAALRRREVIYERARRVAAATLDRLDRFFAAHDARLGWVRPRGGLTAFPWLRSGADARPFCEAAAARGVLIAPGDCFDLPAHFRIGLAAITEGVDLALERLGAVLAQTPTG